MGILSVNSISSHNQSPIIQKNNFFSRIFNGVISSHQQPKVDEFCHSCKQETPVSSPISQSSVSSYASQETIVNGNLKLIKNGKNVEIKVNDGRTLYSQVKDYDSTTETIFSLKGKKLYETKTYSDGSAVKIFYDENGEIRKTVNINADNTVHSVEEKTIDYSNSNTVLPEYFYHFTTKENYESMKKDGYIKTTTDRFLSHEGNQAVFLVDLDNLISGWSSLQKGDEKSSLVRLIKFCDKNKTGEIVALKIPSSVLNKNDLTFRTQEEVLEPFSELRVPNKYSSLSSKFTQLFLKHFGTKKYKEVMIHHDSIFLPERIKHLSQGLEIDKLPEHQSDAIEYLCRSEIPVTCVVDEKVIDTSFLENETYWNLDVEKKLSEVLLSALSKNQE